MNCEDKGNQYPILAPTAPVQPVYNPQEYIYGKDTRPSNLSEAIGAPFRILGDAISPKKEEYDKQFAEQESQYEKDKITFPQRLKEYQESKKAWEAQHNPNLAK